MNETELTRMLGQLMEGDTTISQVINNLKTSLFRQTALQFAKPDVHRELRHGLTEVIYGQGKSVEEIISIAKELSYQDRRVLITRLDTEKIDALSHVFQNSRINDKAKTLMINPPDLPLLNSHKASVAIVAAGTSDINVAEEAHEVCIAMQILTECIYDVGVSGLHRILRSLDALQQSSVIIVVAGMEGALPSVLGGLVGQPVIAVPTSVGYGASFNGLAALLGMLNSCAPGLVVTNIDAGFSAGFAAARIINGFK